MKAKVGSQCMKGVQPWSSHCIMDANVDIETGIFLAICLLALLFGSLAPKTLSKQRIFNFLPHLIMI